MRNISSRSRRQNFFLILMLGILSAVTPFSIDLYLPAFPEIAQALNTSLARVAFSVSTYFMGYAFGQLLYGPLLDRYGRKPPLYVGLILYILASVACMNSQSIEQLLIYRLMQALGGSVAGVAAIAMVKDFFPADEGAKVFSLLMLVLSTSPLLAPSMGSFIVAAWGWQGTFAALAGLGFVVLGLIFFFLPEGHKGDHDVVLNFKSIWTSFMVILKQPPFYVYTLAGSFSFAGLFVYVAGSPAIFMDEFKVSAQFYSGIFAFLSIGMIGGSQLNLFFMRKFDSRTIFKTALFVQVLVGLTFLYGAWSHLLGLKATIAFLFLILSCSGITYPNASALALAPFSKNAGTASALLGFLQLGIGALISGCIGFLEMKGTLPTALVIFFSSAIGLLILHSGQMKSKHKINFIL